jgi:hypothetical protein
VWDSRSQTFRVADYVHAVQMCVRGRAQNLSLWDASFPSLV